MNASNSSRRVPPLRVRYWELPEDIVDIAWWFDPAMTDPPSIADLVSDPHPMSKHQWDVEDPTDPDNETYPADEVAELSPVDLVRCAASHWQRVTPRMRRFTQSELKQAEFLAALGAVEQALKILVESRQGQCAYVLEQHPDYQP